MGIFYTTKWVAERIEVSKSSGEKRGIIMISTYRIFFVLILVFCAPALLAKDKAASSKTKMSQKQGSAYVLKGRMMAENDCPFEMVNTYTGSVVKTVIRQCTFSQTQDEIAKNHVAYVRLKSTVPANKCLYEEVNTYTGAIVDVVIQDCPKGTTSPTNTAPASATN